jgi:hypothetical protein
MEFEETFPEYDANGAKPNNGTPALIETSESDRPTDDTDTLTRSTDGQTHENGSLSHESGTVAYENGGLSHENGSPAHMNGGLRRDSLLAAPSAAPSAPVADVTEAMFQEQLDRRMREAEVLLKQTIEQMRVEEEQRLTEWAEERKAEEERRLLTWADERRTHVERSFEQRKSDTEALAQRLQDMLAEWQDSFEERLDRRRLEEQRLADRRRITDEERLSIWRAELEVALTERLSRRRPTARVEGRDSELRASLESAVSTATSARDVGRILRDVLSEMAPTSAFAVSLHQPGRDDIAYRYRVASDDEVGAVLRGDSLDDGPQSAAAHMDGWARAHRALRIGDRNATVHTAQLAMRLNDATIGVLTMQTEGDPIADSVLARVTELAAIAAPRLVELRDQGSFRGA